MVRRSRGPQLQDFIALHDIEDHTSSTPQSYTLDAGHEIQESTTPSSTSSSIAPAVTPSSRDSAALTIAQDDWSLQRPSEVIVTHPSSRAGPRDTAEMTSRPASFIHSVGSYRVESSPYGSMSSTPSRNESPTRIPRTTSSHKLRRVSETSRNSLPRLSKLPSPSEQPSRRSEDHDGAMLITGLEGRFGVSEASIPGEMLGNDSKSTPSSNSGGSHAGPFDSEDEETSLNLEPELGDDSPHEIVRASVLPTDDTTLSINTPRMWCLSVLFSFLGSSTNLFFSLRYPSVAITPVIALLLVHPLGLLWDYSLKRRYDPNEEFLDGHRVSSTTEFDDSSLRPGKSRRIRRWLAQGRWNEKEHTCVYVSSNVAFGFAFATDVIVEQTQFYNQKAPITYQLLLTISTQILGYGFAGLTRRFLVRPSDMIWPGTLMSAAMFSTLHKQDNKPANGWKISRWNFFYILWTSSFIFYFLPGLLMPALSYFNVITWFAPKSVVIANLFGVSSGLGLFPMTFDWAQITYIGSPLLVPFWAAVNVIGGLAIVMWIIAPLFYYSNVLYSAYMPILSTAVFDNTGKVYEVGRILTSDFLFDKVAYKTYSRVFLPATYVLSYGVQFAGLAALLTHTACWHGKDIWQTWQKALREVKEEDAPGYQPVPGSLGRSSTDVSENPNLAALSTSISNATGISSREDVHCRLMRRYEDAPLSWYLLISASMAAIGVFVVE